MQKCEELGFIGNLGERTAKKADRDPFLPDRRLKMGDRDAFLADRRSKRPDRAPKMPKNTRRNSV
jgi:hypothetical protein